MKLVEQHDIILNQKCEPFNFDEPVMDPYELSNELQKIRAEGGGIGLAAPQVGINTQVLVIGMGNFQTEGPEDYNQVFFNPNILFFSRVIFFRSLSISGNIFLSIFLISVIEQNLLSTILFFFL